MRTSISIIAAALLNIAGGVTGGIIILLMVSTFIALVQDIKELLKA